jgi:Domain of unknown function (DUF4333)
MNLSTDPNSTTSPELAAGPRRWLGCSLAAGVLVAVSLAVAACGSSGSPTILNTEKVERAIEQSSLAQRGKHARVSCPSGVHQTKGLIFSCTAVVGRGSTRFVVTETDGSGNVHYEAR